MDHHRDFYDTRHARQPLGEAHGNAQPIGGGLGSLDSCSPDPHSLVLASQRLYSDLLARHTRHPLKEADGNSQASSHGLGGLKDVCQPNYGGIMSLPSSIPRPLIVPTQSFGDYGSAMGDLRLRRQLKESRRHDVNPFYLVPQFDAYRKKQMDKDENTKVWPDLFEHAFIDALLLIPLNFGRKKYSMRGKQYGRNMLISEYIWIVYLLSLPEGAQPDPAMERARKKVSSHLQVVKDFVKHMRYYHFIFPPKEQTGRRRESVLDSESMKDNPVLCALAEQRLPDVRPNYAYFAELLTADALIIVRPKECWILISSTEVTVQLDGQGIKADGQVLDPMKYPHLGLNLQRDSWPKQGSVIRGALLHEYTRSMNQVESTSVQDLTADWDEDFPELVPAVDDLIEQDCKDILHYHVTLEVQEPDEIPGSTHLTSVVEVSIDRPALQMHNWKSVTKLVRPWQLTEGDDATMVEVTKEMGKPFAHRNGCDGSKPNCECLRNARQRKSEMHVSFPADEWAVMLSHLSQHRKHPEDFSSGHQREVDDNDVTQMDLLSKVAMFQELWSCAAEGQPWVRRAVIFWTFESVYHWGKEEKKGPERILKGAAGTKWRFISAIDPDGDYHQQMALIYNTPAGNGTTPSPSHRSAPPQAPYSHDIITPSPHIHHQDPLASLNSYDSKLDQLNALIADYRPAPPTPQSIPHAYDLDAFVADHHGLPTPPPTASLHGAYPPFDTRPLPHHQSHQSHLHRTPTSNPLALAHADITSHPHPHAVHHSQPQPQPTHSLDFLPPASHPSVPSSVCSPATDPLAADPFESHAHLDAAYDDPAALHGWDAQAALDVSPATAAAWSAEYGLSGGEGQWTVAPGEEWQGSSASQSPVAGQSVGTENWGGDLGEDVYGLSAAAGLEGFGMGEESPSVRRRGVKRERSEEEDGEGYPMSSIRRLEHHLSVVDGKVGGGEVGVGEW